MKTRARLLDSGRAREYRIRLTLQEGRTAEFIYNDREIARQHWDQLQGTGVVAGLAIKTYDYSEQEQAREKNTAS